MDQTGVPEGLVRVAGYERVDSLPDEFAAKLLERFNADEAWDFVESAKSRVLGAIPALVAAGQPFSAGLLRLADLVAWLGAVERVLCDSRPPKG